jgi:general secretion pathway protein D
VAVAQKIIQANDKAKSEMIIDVELLEVNRNMLRNLGIDLFGAGTSGGTGKSINLSFGGGSSVSLNNLDLLKQAGSWLVGPIPGVVVNFLKTDADAQIIAKPQLRVSEGSKATVRIGDRIPIPNTTFNAAPTVGGTVGVPITSFTYQNVGINIDLEPRVHHNREITLKGKVEISALAGTVSAGGGLTQPIIGTREIESTIRLRDNETNILAGLLRETERKSLSGVAGLSSIPMLKRLFGSTETQIEQTDIVLMMTPHIIRIPDISEEDLLPLWVGTESNVGLRGSSRQSAFASPFEGDADKRKYPGIADVPEDEFMGAKPKEELSPAEETAVETAPSSIVVPPLTAPANGQPTENGGEKPQGQQQGQTPPPSGGSTGVAPPPGPSPGPGTPATGEPPQPTGPATVTLNPSYKVYGTGAQFTVSVAINGASNVGSVPFHLVFDPSFVEFVGAPNASPFLSQDGTAVFVLTTLTAQKREVIVGLSRQGSRPGANGQGTLIEMTFRTLAKTGTTRIDFSDISVLDPQAQPLPFEKIGMDVVIQ